MITENRLFKYMKDNNWNNKPQVFFNTNTIYVNKYSPG